MWGSSNRDPYVGDSIRAEMAGNDPLEFDDLEENQMLGEFIEFYDCADLLPFADRILELSTVKEALGYIPPDFGLTHEEIRGLVILQQEIAKKQQFDSWKLSQERLKTSK